MALGLLGRLVRLPAADRALLVRAVLALGTARLALWVLSVGTARRLLARYARRPAVHPAPQDHIAWAIQQAQRVVPGATCLPQALAGEALLRHNGHPVDLRIGVLKTDGGRLVAHAWVESGGRVVVGELKRLAQYTPLPPLPDPRA